MTPEEYQRLALRTEPGSGAYYQSHQRLGDGKPMRLLHAAVGMQTEAGEFTDQLKKHIFYGKPLDEVNLAEEIGDAMWYCALACNALNISLGDVMATNIAKLKARFPDKFTEDAANVRDLDAERKVLEGKST